MFAFATAFCIAGGTASAQVAPYMNFGLATQTSTALDAALKSKHDAQAARAYLAAAPSAEDTPPPPVSESEGEVIGFPKGITYAFDITSSFPYGDVGEQRNQLPGGIDASITARIEPRTNVFAQYFQLQPQILHIDNGETPVYIQGTPGSTGLLPLAQLNEGVSTKIDAFIGGFQRLFFVGGAAINSGHPIVFAPVYAAVKADIGGGDLNFQEQYNGGQAMYVEQRVFQEYVANLVIPLSITEKLNVLYYASPEILVHPSGFEQTNHVQYEQQLLVEYNPNKQTTIFFNPSHSLTYFPTDLYPVSTTSFVYGVTHRFRRPSKALIQPYLQAEVITSNPNNPIDNALGVARVTIVPNIGALPTIGGNKFTTVQLSLGIGTPPQVVPYP
jgi:hypothetical protein